MTEPNSALFQTLATHFAMGEDLQRRPYTLEDADIAGAIDAMAVDELGRCWVLGWARESIGNAMGVLILDRAKHPGSLVMARFTRDGLAEGATGFIGILQSEWEPQIETGQVAMVLAVKGQPHLRNTGEGLRRVGIRALAQIADAAKTSLSGGYHEELSRLLAAPESWVPGTARLTNMQVEMAVDNVVAIAGVGCMVEGWVVSPRQAVTGFSLRAGAVISRAEMRSTYRIARPDLAQGFPRAAETLSDAGFVAFFPIADAQALTRELILKVHLGRRDSANFALPEQDIKWLHRRAGESVLLRCYPALDCEPFFPAMAAMIKRATLMQGSRPVIWNSTVTPLALVVAIAPHPDEAFRVMDCLDQWRSIARARGIGFVVLAPEASRAQMLRLVRDWPQGDNEPSLSLFFQTGDIVTPMDVSLILKSLETKSALIIREGVRLDTETVARCLDRLSDMPDDAMASYLPVTADLPAIQKSDGPGALIWSALALDNTARSGAGWAEFPAESEHAGEAQRAIRPAPKRQMLRVLQQAGLKL